MFYLDFFDEILKFLAYIHLFRDTSSIISFIIAIKFPLQGSTNTSQIYPSRTT